MEKIFNLSDSLLDETNPNPLLDFLFDPSVLFLRKHHFYIFELSAQRLINFVDQNFDVKQSEYLDNFFKFTPLGKTTFMFNLLNDLRLDLSALFDEPKLPEWFKLNTDSLLPIFIFSFFLAIKIEPLIFSNFYNAEIAFVLRCRRRHALWTGETG